MLGCSIRPFEIKDGICTSSRGYQNSRKWLSSSSLSHLRIGLYGEPMTLMDHERVSGSRQRSVETEHSMKSRRLQGVHRLMNRLPVEIDAGDHG
jgi:hypothetical protein